MPPSKKKYSEIFTIDMIEYYQSHVVDFVEDIVFQNNKEYFLSDQQKDFLLAIQNNDRVAAKSGKGIGKTGSVSFAILWFLCCFSYPKIICTAPTFPTLKSALWPEVNKWLNKSLVKNIFKHTERKLYLEENSTNWFCEPRAAKDQSSAQGVHEDNLLIIMDEASGVREDIFEAYDTTLTSRNNKFILIGNPIRTSGPFYDAFNKYKHRWKTLTFNAENSPFVKKEQIEYFADKYGIHHDLYLVNICGEFPSGSPDSFLRLSDVHDAVERNDTVLPRGEIEIGIDVARFGDDLTVLYWRQGYKVYTPKILAKNTIPEAVQLVYDTVVEIRKTTGYDKRIRVKVDDTGVGCVTKNTQILTVGGWKNSEEILPNDEVYSKDLDGNVVIEKVINNIKREETRILKNSDGVEFSWSHLLPYKVRKEYDYKISNWEDILKRKYFIYDKDFKWIGKDEGLYIPKQERIMPYGGYSTYDNEVNIDSKTLARFLGWFISEGSFDSNSIKITQVKKDHLEEIKNTLSKIGYCKRKKNDFIIYNKNLVDWLKRECYTENIYNCYNKKVPNIIKNASKETIDIFLDAFRKGDGTLHHGIREYFTSSVILSDDILECIYKIGKYGNKSIKQINGSKSYIFGRKITRTTNCWWIYEYKNNNNITYSPKNNEIQEYFDNVQYITITGDTKLFFTRMKDNYKAFWTHNGGLTDFLKLDREHNIEVVPCNNGGKGNDVYQNEISIMWGHFKDELKFIGLPEEKGDHLINELSARRWRLSNAGKIMIEPKSEFKKEYKASPDRADALMLCFARKVNEDTIIKDFDPLDSCLIKSNLNYIGENKFASIFYSKDLTTSIVYTSWDGNRLFVYDEFIGKDSLIHIATNIHQHLPINKIIGNDTMFDLKGDDLATKFRKFGVNIKENYFYNELSAIESVSNMITQRKIVINKQCENIITQLSNWKIDKSKFELENTYGLCYALSYIVSELRKKIEIKQVDPIISYGKSKENNIFDEINLSSFDSWMLN